MVKAAVAAPDAVSTGRCMRTKSRTAKPSFASRRCAYCGIGHGKGRKMQSGVTAKRRVEFAAKRRVRGLEQDFEITARQHRGDVAGSGRARAARRSGLDLNRYRRRREAAARQRPASRFAVAHEMPDVIEKDFVAGGEPAIDSVRRGFG